MKKKIASVLAVSVIATNNMPALNVFADKVIKEKAIAIEKQIAKDMSVGEFKLKNNPKFNIYNELYKVNITSITNNGGSYPNSQLEKAIDGNLGTHWETNKPNSANFTNEVVMELAEVSNVNRLAYATRQDGAKTKGYPIDAKIYVSESGSEDDFVLAGSVKGTPVTGNMVEFKFDTVKAKKIKFVFAKAHNEYASASEFWLYKEDEVLESMERLFTDETMSKVSPEFASENKLADLEEKVKAHPFCDNFIEDIANAKKILENNPVKFSETKVSKLLGYGTENQQAYDEAFMLPYNKITNFEANGGTYKNSKAEYMYDGEYETHWESNKHNSDSFTNEVVFTFDEIQNLDRIALLPRSLNQKGFPTNYEIYASETSKGEAFKLVSSGTAKVTSEFMQFKFNPTNFKRLKFVFKDCHMGKPFISEARFYKQDTVSEKMETLFTDSNKNEVNPDLATPEKLTALENEAKSHPLYSQFKEDLEDARHVLEGNEVNYVDAKVSKFKEFGTPELKEYDKTYKLNIDSITTNGRHWGGQTIDKAIDGDVNTYWHSDATNNQNHTNEVIMTLDKLQTLDKVVYTSKRDRGFAKEFEIYTSKTLSGDTFTKVTSGSASITQDSLAIKFNPTQARRVKFVFKSAHEGWALASEFGLYKEDEVLNKMDRLFTDNTLSTLGEEFDTVEELDALENEAKAHPFYNDFKEDLANARILLEQEDIESGVASTRVFNHLDNKAYNDKFIVPYSNIKKITNNAGNYGSQTIDKAADGNMSTYWETNKANTDDWKNEVTVEFINPVTINRLVYAARQDNAKGFAQEFEIYASTTSKGETFKLVATGKANKTKDLIEAKFQPTKFKRIKLKWTKGDANWASLSEIMFFTEDTVADKANSLFTNELKNELVPEFDSLEELKALEAEVMKHPLKEELMLHLNMAKDLLESPEEAKGRVYEVERRGNTVKESQKRKVWNFRDWLPTGLAVRSGDKITVYVDAEPGEPLPNLVFKQMDSERYGLKDIALKRGKNEITIPEVEAEFVRPGKPLAGVLYISNSYTEEQQSREPKIRIIGGVAYPQYVKGVSTDEQVMKDLKEYNEKLKQDPTLPDVFEVFSDKTLVNATATYALNWYTDNNKVPSYTADKHDEIIKETMKFWGFDGSKEEHSDFNFRYVVMLKNLRVFMDAANGITGYNLSEQAGALNADTGWGFMHEMGHNFDTTNRDIQEVTNNILPLHYQMLKGEPSRISQQNLWERRIFPNVSKEDYSNNEWYPDNDRGVLTHMAPLWQLQLYDNTFWPRFEQQFRERNIDGTNWDDIHASWAVVASDVLQLDLTEHFARHGFYVDEETEKHMSQYKKPDKKLWYLNDNKYLKEGQGFNNELDCDLTVKVNQDSTKLTMAIDNVNENSLLGYEIVRDGKVIGFTTQSSFVDNTANPETNHEYKVIPYDININPAEGTIIKSHKPFIETVGGVTLALNEEFNPLDYVKATDYKGDEIEDVKFTSNVDTKNKGDYTVTYEVTTEGVTTTEVLNVTVASKYDYLSDREWDSAECPEVTPTRNTSVKGNSLGEVKSFDKGFRMHAVGKAVYNLGEHNYDEFEVKVGVDMNVPAQNFSSVSFRIVGDGKTLATSEVLTREDNLQYIKVPIKGVNQLVLEFNDGGNGNKYDHATMIEPKLITNDTKPELTIPKSQTVKVGETLEDLKGNFEATDIEDGNLTNSVVVTGTEEVNFNRVGNYTITYTVTDKDGNSVEKTRVISVVNPEDFRYLSDYEWKTASSGDGTVQKDKSISKGKLRLTGENGEEVTYDKGLGTHAVSTIVYDLTDKNVNTFSSFIGVDRKVYDRDLNVSFEVHVDGEEVYNSGVMNSKDEQKFVEVNLAGAKELKLIVKDGGDKSSYDHANWADAKLYFINKDRVYATDLTKAIEEAKKLDKDAYTEESMKTLEDKLAKAEALMEEDKPSQEAIDIATDELNEAMKALEEVNLDEVVSVPDTYLANAIRKELDKEEGNLTVRDMRQLIKLNIEHSVSSLEGLQHAINLESLTCGIGEIKDLRPLANLKKLDTVQFDEQYITVGEVYSAEGKLTLNTEVYGKTGKNIATKVSIKKPNGTLVKEQVLDNADKTTTIDVTDVESGYYAVHVTYSDNDINGVLIYMTRI